MTKRHYPPDDPRAKNHLVTVRITDKQFDLLNMVSKDIGLTVSDMIRIMINDKADALAKLVKGDL